MSLENVERTPTEEPHSGFALAERYARGQVAPAVYSGLGQSTSLAKHGQAQISFLEKGKV